MALHDINHLLAINITIYYAPCTLTSDTFCVYSTVRTNAALYSTSLKFEIGIRLIHSTRWWWWWLILTSVTFSFNVKFKYHLHVPSSIFIRLLCSDNIHTFECTTADAIDAKTFNREEMKWRKISAKCVLCCRYQSTLNRANFIQQEME